MVSSAWVYGRWQRPIDITHGHRVSKRRKERRKKKQCACVSSLNTLLPYSRDPLSPHRLFRARARACAHAFSPFLFFFLSFSVNLNPNQIFTSNWWILIARDNYASVLKQTRCTTKFETVGSDSSTHTHTSLQFCSTQPVKFFSYLFSMITYHTHTILHILLYSIRTKLSK